MTTSPVTATKSVKMIKPLSLVVVVVIVIVIVIVVVTVVASTVARKGRQRRWLFCFQGIALILSIIVTPKANALSSRWTLNKDALAVENSGKHELPNSIPQA